MSEQYFEAVAGQWDELRAAMFTEAVRDAALAEAGLHPSAVAADIGAGTGFITQGLAPLVAEVHVVDSSPQMLEVARHNLAAWDNIVYHLADGASLPLPDTSVDAVLANMYLHHCADPLAAVREMARILKPGGRLVITDMDEHPHTWLREEHHDLWLGFPRSEVGAWLGAAGLVNVQVKDSRQTCSTTSQESAAQTATISIFAAVGSKPVPEMVQNVEDRYRRIALESGSCCGPAAGEGASCCGPEASNLISLDQIASGAAVMENPAEISLGCGNPLALAGLREGETVLDIGSGAGADLFPAAQRVGPQGRVIGLDRLEEMLARARQTARKHNYTNVEFRQGDAQEIPLPEASVDVVMSNCVINLVQDKGQAFREAFRVLRPGGRLSISDIVTDRPFSPALRSDPEAWSACVTGALPEAEYLALIAQAGFTAITASRSAALPAEDGTQVYSLNVSAQKPAP